MCFDRTGGKFAGGGLLPAPPEVSGPRHWNRSCPAQILTPARPGLCEPGSSVAGRCSRAGSTPCREHLVRSNPFSWLPAPLPRTCSGSRRSTHPPSDTTTFWCGYTRPAWNRGTWHTMSGLPYPIRLAGFGPRRPKYASPGRNLAGTEIRRRRGELAGSSDRVLREGVGGHLLRAGCRRSGLRAFLRDPDHRALSASEPAVRVV